MKTDLKNIKNKFNKTKMELKTYQDTDLKHLEKKTQKQMFNINAVADVLKDIKSKNLKNVDADLLFNALKNGKKQTDNNHKQYYLKRAICLALLPKNTEITRNFNDTKNTETINKHLNKSAVDVSLKKLADNTTRHILNIDFKNLYK
jgi:hypothetical protein